MATLLTMVNQFRRRIRHDTVTAVSTSDPVSDLAVDMINESAHELFENYAWNWLKYEDGVINLDEPRSGTDANVSRNSTTVTDFKFSTAGESVDALARIAVPTASAKIRFTGDTVFPDTTYRIASFLGTGASGGFVTFTIELDAAYNGDLDVASVLAWTINSHEYILPVTVQKVLSVSHLGQPLVLRFVNRDQDYDLRVPRPLDTSGNPLFAIVGNVIANTVDQDASPTQTSAPRPSIEIWPVPDSFITLDYSYIKRHIDLSADTDEFAAVPDLANSYIVWDAAGKYYAGPGDDQDRFKSIFAANQGRLFQLKTSDVQDPTRRHIARPYDHYGIGNPRSRWETQLIPEPS